jgi:hypothetical protein
VSTPLRPAILEVTSAPSGASVEVGIKCIKNIVTPGTGRNAGKTPLRTTLRKTDLTTCVGSVQLYYQVTLKGYIPEMMIINFGPNGAPEPGKVYRKHFVLEKLP